MENYKIIGRAGEGAHGFVFKALDKQSLKVVALKRISFNANAGIPKNILREMLALRALKYEYVVGLYDIIPISSGITLVMEYLPCSLTDVLRNHKNPIELPQIKLYMKMFLMGVNYIHSNHIIHRDLKPANLLISELGVLKLADFGLARIFKQGLNRTYSHQVATRWYRAPELLYGSSKYSLAIDMWSVGCILVEMINKRPLFPGETDIEQLAIVLNTLGPPTEEIWPGLHDLPDYNKITFTVSSGKSWESIVPNADPTTISLIEALVQYNDKKRPTASQTLTHEFFASDPKPCDLTELPCLDEIKEIVNSDMEDFEDFCF